MRRIISKYRQEREKEPVKYHHGLEVLDSLLHGQILVPYSRSDVEYVS